MYNRYIRGDSGVYTRIPEEEPQRPNGPSGGGPPPGNGPGRPGAPNGPVHPGGGPGGPAGPGAPPPNGPFQPPPPKGPDGLSAALRRLLDKFHLDSVDSGDLLLLLLLFFLFKEDADDELLIALGLLLVL